MKARARTHKARRDFRSCDFCDGSPAFGRREVELQTHDSSKLSLNCSIYHYQKFVPEAPENPQRGCILHSISELQLAAFNRPLAERPHLASPSRESVKLRLRLCRRGGAPCREGGSFEGPEVLSLKKRIYAGYTISYYIMIY